VAAGCDVEMAAAAATRGGTETALHGARTSSVVVAKEMLNRQIDKAGKGNLRLIRDWFEYLFAQCRGARPYFWLTFW
jgi:hypothetical protein